MVSRALLGIYSSYFGSVAERCLLIVARHRPVLRPERHAREKVEKKSDYSHSSFYIISAFVVLFQILVKVRYDAEALLSHIETEDFLLQLY